MKERWSARALDDRLGLIDYLTTAAGAAVATNIDDAIEERVRLLLDMPMSGRTGRAAGTREAVVSHTPYIVIYAVEADVLRIIRVVHGAQLWPPGDT